MSTLSTKPSFFKRHLWNIVAGVVTSGALAWAVILHLRASELAEEVADAERDAQTVSRAIANRPALTRNLATARAAVTHLETHLVRESELAQNIAEFYELERRLNLRLVQIRQLNAAPLTAGKKYTLVPFSLQVAGPFNSVLSLLQELETRPRVGRIRSFEIRARPDQPDTLDLDLELETLGTTEPAK